MNECCITRNNDLSRCKVGDEIQTTAILLTVLQCSCQLCKGMQYKRSDTRTHTHTDAHTPTNTHPHIHAHARTQTHTHAHTRTHTHAHSYFPSLCLNYIQ